MKTKATIYMIGMLGLSRHEVHLTEHGRRKYAQHDNAPYALFVPKGARKLRRMQTDYKPYLVILSGWNNPLPPSPYALDERGSSMVGRYSMCDPQWDVDADTFLASIMTDENTIADYRHTQGA